jgi:hypothetical protein
MVAYVKKDLRESIRTPNRVSIEAALERMQEAVLRCEEREREALAGLQRAQELRADVQRVDGVVSEEVAAACEDAQAAQSAEQRRLEQLVLIPVAKEVANYVEKARQDLESCREACRAAGRQVGWHARLSAREEQLSVERISLGDEVKATAADTTAFLNAAERAVAEAEQLLERNHVK